MEPLDIALTVRTAVNTIRDGWGNRIAPGSTIACALRRLDDLVEKLEEEGQNET